MWIKSYYWMTLEKWKQPLYQSPNSLTAFQPTIHPLEHKQNIFRRFIVDLALGGIILFKSFFS